MAAFVLVIEGPREVAIPAGFERVENAISCARDLVEAGRVEDASVVETSTGRVVWRA